MSAPAQVLLRCCWPSLVTGLMRRLEAAGRGLAITFVEGVIERLPFTDASFDAVTARRFIWTLLEPTKAFAEWRRVLTPSGSVVADCSLNAEVAAYHYTDGVAAALPFCAITDPTPVARALRSTGFGKVGVEISRGSDQHQRTLLRARTGIVGKPTGTPRHRGGRRSRPSASRTRR